MKLTHYLTVPPVPHSMNRGHILRGKKTRLPTNLEDGGRHASAAPLPRPASAATVTHFLWRAQSTLSGLRSAVHIPNVLRLHTFTPDLSDLLRVVFGPPVYRGRTRHGACILGLLCMFPRRIGSVGCQNLIEVNE